MAITIIFADSWKVLSPVLIKVPLLSNEPGLQTVEYFKGRRIYNWLWSIPSKELVVKLNFDTLFCFQLSVSLIKTTLNRIFFNDSHGKNFFLASRGLSQTYKARGQRHLGMKMTFRFDKSRDVHLKSICIQTMLLTLNNVRLSRRGGLNEIHIFKWINCFVKRIIIHSQIRIL